MKNLDFLTKNLIAHRGYHDKDDGIPENSIFSFQKAIENNYIIELDVHLIKDGNIVVFHDDNLNRMTGIDKAIKDTTYDEISKLNLLNTNCKIPLLVEVLNLVKGQVPIIIELKCDLKAGLLESKIMEILKNYNGKFAVKSFNPFSVLWFKENYPEIIRGQLSSDFSKSDYIWIKKIFLRSLIMNVFTKPDFISYAIDSLPNKKVEKYREKNLVLGWTAKNQIQYEKGLKYCDNVICENFDKLKIKES